MVADTPAAGERRLDDVMLAMDVVDTLRHREHLVERELHAGDRDEKLRERLREIYTSQGIEVPDRVLDAGVAALREERFVYKPPVDGFAVKLAHLYIERGKWTKRISVLFAAILASWASFTVFITGPAERDLQEQVSELNRGISSASERIDTLANEAARLAAELPDATQGVPPSLKKAARSRVATAEQSLKQAQVLVESARGLSQPADLESETFTERSASATPRLQQQQEQIERLQQEVKTAQRALEEIAALRRLPDELASVRDAVLAAAQEEEGRAEAEQLYTSGLSALRAGDVAQAESAVTELKSLHTWLEQTYTLRIISRPGEQSGVWRIPEANPNARNYYIIVEAVAPNGEVAPQRVTSEEDGKTERVSSWGLRVDEAVFNRVRADKQDDGIIQNRRFGTKRRGYLSPEYDFETSGDAIIRW